MHQSITLYIGMDVHKDSIGVAYVAKAHDEEDAFLGTIGTWQADINQLVRKLQSQAKPLVYVYEAGPCGYWLYRDWTNKGHVSSAVEPSLILNAPAQIPGWTSRRLSSVSNPAGSGRTSATQVLLTEARPICGGPRRSSVTPVNHHP